MRHICFGQRRKRLDDGRGPVDLENLTEKDVKSLKKKQLQEILASFGLPNSGNVQDLKARVLSLKKKESEDRADKDQDQNEQGGEELVAQHGKRVQLPESQQSAAVSDPRQYLSSASGSDKKKKWRVTDPAQIAPNFYHRDLFLANFPLVEVVDVPERTRFPVQDKFQGITLDDTETAEARRKWFQVFLKAEHAYAKAETESQAFPVHFAFLDAIWQFTKPSFKEVDVHRERCRGLKRKLPFDDMLAECKRLKPGSEENSGLCINPEIEEVEEPFGAKRSDGDNEGLSIVPEEAAELYGDLQQDVDAATGFADGVLHVHDDRPQKKAATTGSSIMFDPDRVVAVMERKFAEDKHKWNARFQGGFYAAKHTMANLSRGDGRPVYVLVKTSSSWSYGILVPEGFVQIRGGAIDVKSMSEFGKHQQLTGIQQMGLEELDLKLQKGTDFYRKNFRNKPQANYADGPMLVGTFYLCSEWFSLPKAEYGNGQVEGPRRLFDGLMRLVLEEKRSRFGWNELVKPDGKPFWKLVAEQFEDTLVQILLAAAGASFILALTDVEEGQVVGLESFTEPIIILSIIVLNAVIGVWQESKAENTLEALKQMQSESARVLRNGKEIAQLPSRELVPGDIVELRAGDKVSADMRVAYLKSGTIRLQQASLTGESQPVLKQAEGAFEEEIELQGKENMVFSGTTVTNGTCVCIVTNTGMDTELGKIQAQIQDASLANYDSPLTRKLEEFADTLTKFVGAVCVVVWLVNYKYYLTWDASSGFPSDIQFNLEQATYYFKVAVALAVAAIPEGLPAVITTCLALGTRRMAEENAIVRKLPSVETLGCTTVICSDKTGTLTTNEMSVVQIAVMQESGQMQGFTVTGTTFNPRDGTVIGLQGCLGSNIDVLAQVCSVCNDASIEFKDDRYVANGMPTEAALLVLVEKLGSKEKSISNNHVAVQDTSNKDLNVCHTYQSAYKKLFTLEFDRVRKSMGVIVAEDLGFEGRNKLLVKGAAEFVLERCTSVTVSDGSIIPLLPNLREEIIASINVMASKGLRILACACKTGLGSLDEYTGPEHSTHQLLLNTETYATIESQLSFVGLVGMQDPPRQEVKDAIKACKRAGIGVVVITGDNKSTAEAICREIGLFNQNEDLSSKSFFGRDFMRLSQSERRNILLGNMGKSFVFSRAEPIHKQEIVRVLKGIGEVVAMTGDGVNDAPALKLADIGIAMGITGTEVAKEASDMILADDNFATIVVAVKEGRAIYDNMRAFIRYLISSNIGEVVAIFSTALLGFPQGLIPVQLLWVNLVTDGAPATALGFNPPDKDIMERAPRSPEEGLISGWMLFRFLAVGSYVGLATVGIFVLWYINNDSFMGIDMSRDGHTAITLDQLSHWGECANWVNFHPSPYTAGSQIFTFSDPCSYFTDGKVKPSTLSMSTLVVTEMFNALNALSERNSLLQVPPWVNRWLLGAIAVSMGLHFTILYTPWLAEAFGVVPLSYNEWLLVVLFSFPVVPLEEALKLIGRTLFAPQVKR